MAERIDGNTLRTQRTRARILAASLALFNERGQARAGTAAIAAAVGISPGNLYYHFRNKDEIVEGLFTQLEARVDLPASRAAGNAEAVEDLWLYLHLVLEAVWDYRFLYRALDDLVGRNRRLRDRFARMAEGQRGALEGLCEALAASGAMRASADERRALARSALIVATYWLGFRAITAPPGRHHEDVGLGAYQVMTLFAPFLAGPARRHLDGLRRRYLD